MSPGTVFISYSSRDRKEAFELKQLLEGHGIKVWLDFFDIQTTAELRGQLAARVRQAGLFCLLLSPSAVESRWVTEEIATALAAADEGLRILPIILRPCRIPVQLENIVGFDASEGLEHEAVRLRLLRAVSGEAAVEQAVLLDAATRLLLANKALVLRAEAELPAVAEQIALVAGQPIRSIALEIRPETLPEDPNVILELQLQLDTLFHGVMSFYIARYREGRTWPAEFHFQEPPFTAFFLDERPRLDVQFKWFDRVIPLGVQIDGTDLKSLPATFRLEFDGMQFKPVGEMNLPQTFEIPSLDTLAHENSAFRLIAHDTGTKQAHEISFETDIDISLMANPGKDEVCLYASRSTPEQRAVLRGEYLGQVAHAIRRTVLLQRYRGGRSGGDRRPEIVAALDKREFESEEQRRLAARFRYSEAVLARFRTLHRDAYRKFQEAAELLQPLVFEKPASLEDATLIYLACRALVEIWLRQESYKEAGQLAETLARVAGTIKESDADNPDFQRMWSQAMFVNADLHARLGDKPSAASELHESLETLRRLHDQLPSADRRAEYLQALTHSIRSAGEWGIEDAVPIVRWKAELAAMVGDVAAEKLVRPRSPEELPRWLEESDPAGWPTAPLESATLRYSLRLPAHWHAEAEVRGTSREVEHLYHGKSDSEWLYVSFMDKAEDTSDMTLWVETFIRICGFPVLTKISPPPKLGRWTYLGKLAGLKKKLDVDEAHAYTGLAEYSEGELRLLGRMYIVMARRKRFAWKLALSFGTACFDGVPEDMVSSQDHVRAGAVLGTLRLG